MFCLNKQLLIDGTKSCMGNEAIFIIWNFIMTDDPFCPAQLCMSRTTSGPNVRRGGWLYDQKSDCTLLCTDIQPPSVDLVTL